MVNTVIIIVVAVLAIAAIGVFLFMKQQDMVDSTINTNDTTDSGDNTNPTINCPKCAVGDITFGPSAARSILENDFDEMVNFACLGQDDLATQMNVTAEAAAVACAADANCKSIQLNHSQMWFDMSSTCTNPVANNGYTTYVKNT